MKFFKYLSVVLLTVLSFTSISAETIIDENPNFASTKRANNLDYSMERFQVYNSGQAKYYGFETNAYGSADGIVVDLGNNVTGTFTTTSKIVSRPPSFLYYRALQVNSDVNIALSAPSNGFAFFIIDNDELSAQLDVTFYFADGTSETKKVNSSAIANSTLQFFGHVTDRAFYKVKISGSALSDSDGVYIDNLTAINALKFRDPVTFKNFYRGISNSCNQIGATYNSNGELILSDGGALGCGGNNHAAGKVKLITLTISGERFVGKGIEDRCWVSSNYSNASVTSSSPYWRHETIGSQKISTLYVRSEQVPRVSGIRGTYGISCQLDKPELHKLKIVGSANSDYSDKY